MTPKQEKRRPAPQPVRRAQAKLADDLVAWRKLRGLTRSQLAERAGVGLSTLQRLENGDGGVGTEALLRVLRSLGILGSFSRALDPYESDLGRLRSDELLPTRVRPRPLDSGDDG
jgi:transcriptional regulator with XRE-family HTH domain